VTVSGTQATALNALMSLAATVSNPGYFLQVEATYLSGPVGEIIKRASVFSSCEARAPSPPPALSSGLGLASSPPPSSHRLR
jgi:hypothetical protein